MSENARFEDPPQEGEAFDYDARPSRFYFNVEGSGMLEPDVIVQNGIKVLQQKLASVIHELNASDGGVADEDGHGARSPEVGAASGDPWEGFTTPYGNGGNQSSWGGAGGTTPYDATSPYGNSGQGWNNGS